MLFELIEVGREFLTERNVPELPCTVCLLDIVEEDSFVRTNCYHYFHSVCIGRYVEHARMSSKEQSEDFPANLRPHLREEKSPDSNAVLCPVCREELKDVRYVLLPILTTLCLYKN